MTQNREFVWQEEDVKRKKIVKDENIVCLSHNIWCASNQKDVIPMEDVLLFINVQRVYFAFQCDDAETKEDAVEMNSKRPLIIL